MDTKRNENSYLIRHGWKELNFGYWTHPEHQQRCSAASAVRMTEKDEARKRGIERKPVVVRELEMEE